MLNSRGSLRVRPVRGVRSNDRVRAVRNVKVLNQGLDSAVAIVTAATLMPLVAGNGDKHILMASVLAVLAGIWATIGASLGC